MIEKPLLFFSSSGNQLFNLPLFCKNRQLGHTSCLSKINFQNYCFKKTHFQKCPLKKNTFKVTPSKKKQKTKNNILLQLFSLRTAEL